MGHAAGFPRRGEAYYPRQPAGRLASAAKRALQRGLYSSHDYGMVGFVKELVDELGMADITHPEHGLSPPRASKIREKRLSASHLFVVKA